MLTCECGKEYCVETDFLGDFEQQGLPRNKAFTVVVSAEGYKSVTIESRTKAAVNLGEIVLEKA